MAIKGIAYKNKGDKEGTPINVPDGETLTVKQDGNRYNLSIDPFRSYAYYLINRVDNGSKIDVKPSAVTDAETIESANCPAGKETIFNKVDSFRDKLININDFIHDNPELGHQEFKAHKLLVETLKDNGFEVKTPVSNLNTAFEATYVSGNGSGPVIGILAEYDALQGLGHGCGHNIIAASAVGSALALAKGLGDTSATIKVFGTPAEETDGGKVTMAKDGVFDKCDVILMAHPSDNTTAGCPYLALQDIKLAYKGKPAHAASAEDGRSALAATIAFFNGTDSLRQFVRDDARLHGIITKGGDAANVVPELAEIDFSVRANDVKYLRELTERVHKIAQAAALMTDTELEFKPGLTYENPLVLPKLKYLMLENAKLAGAERIEEPSGGGSSDFGNVSQRVPAESLDIEFVPLDTACHTQDWVNAGNSPAGHEAIIRASKAIAGTAFDLIQNPDMLKGIKEEFQKAKKE